MINVQTKELRDALALLRKHISVEDIQLQTNTPDILTLRASTPYDSAVVYLPCRANEYEHFGINADRLGKICSGRSNLQLSLNGTELRFGGTGKDYRGQISILPPEDISAAPPERPPLSTEFQHIAKYYFPMLKISDVQANRDLAVMLRHQGSLELATTDLLHAAIIKTGIETPFNQNLPLSHALKLSTILTDEQSGYVLANNSLYCWNAKLELRHAIVGELLESTQAIAVMKKLAAPLAMAKIDVAALRNICHNLHAVHEDSSVITLNLVPDGLTLSCSSTHGTITDKLVAEVKSKVAKLMITINFSILLDVIDGPLQAGFAIMEFRPSLNNQVIMCLRHAIDNEAEVVYYIIAFAT